MIRGTLAAVPAVPAATSGRRRSRAVSVGTVALVVGALGACSSDDPDNVGVCVDQQTNQRVQDDDCNNGRSGHGWYYIPRGGVFPRVGSAVSGGSFNTPSGSFAKGGVSSSGGDISRGGFDSGKSSFGG